MQEIKTSEGYSLEDIVKSVISVLKPEEVHEVEKFDGYIPEGTVKEYRDIENYPPILHAKHIKEYLGISDTFAYEVLNSASCPTIRIGKRLVVSRDSFVRYLQQSEGSNLL